MFKLYTRFGYTEIKIGEYSKRKYANLMLDKAVSIWGYGKLVYTTKKGIEVIKIKRRTFKIKHKD